MPIYEYECSECGHCEDYLLTFDQMKNNPPITCSECGKEALVKVFGRFHAHYKGAGFYTTESRGITGRKRKPNIKVGLKADLPQEEQERMS